MVFMITLIIVLSVATFIPFAMDAGPTVDAQLKGKAIAGEMIVWHAAATRACATSACQGIVNPLAYMSSNFTNKNDFSGGSINSYVQDGSVYTSYSLPAGGQSSAVYGETLASLKALLGTDAATYAGRYSQGEIGLGGTNYYTYRDPEDATRTITATFPIGPIAVPAGAEAFATDGSPMIATLVAGAAAGAVSAP